VTEPVPDGAKAPSVSVLFLVKNGLPILRASLEAIQHQDYPGAVEIVCIDSGSTDGALEFVRAHGIEPHLIPPAEFHHGRTRNLAASMAKHEIIVLISADAVPTHDQWLGNLVRHFSDPQVGGVYGKQIPPAGTGPLRTRTMAVTYPDEAEVRAFEPGKPASLRLIRCSNANSAFRTELWRQFRFHERVLVAEDHWMCYNILKAGMKMVYEPAAAVVHGHERSLWGEFKFAVDNAISLQRMGVFDDPILEGGMKYGLARVKDDWDFFAGAGQYGRALHMTALNLMKFAGVQLGKRESVLPEAVLHRISMNYTKMGK